MFRFVLFGVFKYLQKLFVRQYILLTFKFQW